MRCRVWVAFAFAVACVASGAEPTSRPGTTIVEASKPLPRTAHLGTVGYQTTAFEAPFRKKITEKLPELWAGTDMPPPTNDKAEKLDPQQAAAAEAQKRKHVEEEVAKLKNYALANAAGEYVGWCGIVRGMTSGTAGGRTELLIQHCYNDEMSDEHIQVVSVYGAGDFRALLQDPSDAIPPLSLVRVYGMVAVGKDGVPEVSAEYVRVWDWGLFTFMDYGMDKTHPKWLALRQIQGGEVYDPHPKRAWYERVLGKRETTTRPAGDGER